jgi:hypothetical protein
VKQPNHYTCSKDKKRTQDATPFRPYDGAFSPLNGARASATRAWIAAFDHGHVGGRRSDAGRPLFGQIGDCSGDDHGKVRGDGVLLALRCFAVGWACIAGWLGDGPETRPFLPEMNRGLLQLAIFGYLGSVAVISLELALA